MKKLTTHSNKRSAAGLRREALKTLATISTERFSPDSSTPEKLLHELQVHRVELELQNDELRHHQSELERSRARYADLYDHAPVGYFTLDKQGRILEVNSTGAFMLGVERDSLLRRSFRELVDQQSQAAFLAHLEKAFKRKSSQSWDLKILKADGAPIYARLESTPVTADPDHGPCCRSVLIDTTARKQAEDALHKWHEDLEVKVRQRTNELATANRSLEIQIRHRQQADEALKKTLDELESRVQQRTAELLQANQALATEIAQRLEAEEARHRVLRRLIEIQEAERGRIARGLHDQFGQDLAALNLSLKRMSEELPANSRLRPRVGQAMVTLGNLMREAHGLVWDLRPPALDDLGLSVALRRYAGEWANLHGIPVDFHSRGLDGQRLPPPVEITLYRIAQEALTNVFKHARARRVSILVEHRVGHVALIVEDHGLGFLVDSALNNGAGANGHFGLLGMRERAALAGGTITIESTPGSGTTLFARIPLPPKAVETKHARETNSRPAGRRS